MKSYSVFLVLLAAMMIGGCKKDTIPPISQSADNSITGFAFATLSPGVTANISGTSLSAVVQASTNLTSLIPTITLAAGASITPASGVAQNFTNPVVYTVTAENGQTQSYTITVKHNYQVTIDVKYKALGWTAMPDDGDHAQPTASGTGWVQYYSNKSQAIYLVNGSAFGMLINEMKKYDAAGQDKFAILTTDATLTSVGSGAYYNEFKRVADGSAGIVTSPPTGGTFLVYGDVYKKYLVLNRWNGTLGYPTSDESTNTSGFRYNNFIKNGVAGVIIAGPSGAQAIWGKVYKLWGNASYDAGWLRNPISSCDPAIGDNGQIVQFQNGTIKITGTGCGQYQRLNNTLVPVSGDFLSGSIVLNPCY
ncbi:hypothetical protein [Spirosoma flavum]|uniref:DUF5018 domain-containing protein n=1 Tax=Spirosoma flavum TaxID=2048557 RepID=A0ABW6ALW7_9BACT